MEQALHDPIGVVGVSYRQQFVEAGPGVSLLTRIWAPEAPSGRLPVLFVAGWVSSVEGWAPVVRRLAADRPVYYLESREKSSARIEPDEYRVERFSVASLASDLAGACDALGLEPGRFVLMGSSLGATVILEALKGGRTAPRAAFLIGPNAKFRYPWWAGGLFALPARLYPVVRHFVLWYLRTFRVDAEKEPEQMERYRQTLLGADPVRLKLSARGFRGYSVWPGIGDVRPPVAVAYATTDKLHGEESAHILCAALPEATPVACPTNRYMHEAAVVSDLDLFLDRLPG